MRRNNKKKFNYIILNKNIAQTRLLEKDKSSISLSAIKEAIDKNKEQMQSYGDKKRCFWKVSLKTQKRHEDN